jgi:hypothetical protein
VKPHVFGILVVVIVVAHPALVRVWTIEAVEQVVARWMKEHTVTRGTLAVAREDRLVLVKDYGG